MVKKKTDMLVSVDDYEKRVAIVEGKQLLEIYIERHESLPLAGNIYLGEVKDILPGMEAAFVDVGIEKNAFLYVKEAAPVEEDVDSLPLEIQHILKSGQDLLVQIVKEPMGTKGARVTSQVTLPGRYVVLIPFTDFVGVSRRLEEKERERLSKLCGKVKPKKMGVIVRTAASGKSDLDLKRDIRHLIRLWKKISRRVTKSKPPQLVYQEPGLPTRFVRDIFSNDFGRLLVDSPQVHKKITSFIKKTAPELESKIQLYQGKKSLFDTYDIEKKIDEALRRRVWLKSGGYLTIEQTEALTSVDVNTGRYVGKTSLEQTILKTNIEAAVETAKQLRLRDIGGLIVIDFIDMKQMANKNKVLDTLNKELAQDRTKTRVLSFSALGIIEMTRKNVSEELSEFLLDYCACCKGRGKVYSKETAKIRAIRGICDYCKDSQSQAFLFELNPSLVESLVADRKKGLRILRRRTGKRIYVCENPEVELAGYQLIKKGNQIEIEKYLKEQLK